MERYRIDVGHEHGVRPANIVGAIANEAGLDSSFIGRIDIHDDHSLVDLPVGMPKAVFHQLRKAWVCQRKLNLTRVDTSAIAAERTDTPRARGPVMIDMNAESPARVDPAFVAQDGVAVTEPVRRDPDATYTAGDRLLTRDHGPQEIRWIGQQVSRATGALAPVLIRAGTHPQMGDVNMGNIPEAYRTVSDALRPIRFEDYQQNPMDLIRVPRPLDAYEETLNWLHRFDLVD